VRGGWAGCSGGEGACVCVCLCVCVCVCVCVGGCINLEGVVGACFSSALVPEACGQDLLLDAPVLVLACDTLNLVKEALLTGVCVWYGQRRPITVSKRDLLQC
jgi:hypothetical protein